MADLDDHPSEAELLEGIWLATLRDFKWVAAPMILTNVAIWFLVSPYVSPLASCGWFVCASIIPLTRQSIMRGIAAAAPSSMRSRISWLLGVCVLHGLTRGAAVLFFPYIPDLSKAALSLIQVGICSASVATLVGHLPLVVAFITPMLAPLSIMWLRLSTPDSSADLGVWVGAMVALLWIVTLIQAKDFFAIFTESFTLRFQQRGLAATLEQALKQAESANRAKTQFLAAASHDLRQPLHSLALFSMALSRRHLDPRSAEIVECVDLATQALAKLLDGLLDISKLDAGLMQAELHTVPLAPLLFGLANESRELAGRKGLTMHCVCAAALTARTDPLLLERLLRNLIDNALKYTLDGGVTISAEAAPHHVVVRVSDTGIGIAAPEHARVFEEFYQLGNSERDRAKGLGLGLAIVRRLALLLQAELALASAPGQGSCFSLSLEAGAPAGVAAPAGAAQTVDYSRLRVLVVDDEIGVRQGMRALLEELGCSVLLADGSAAAVQACDGRRPDLVLADFRLRAGDSGIGALRAVWQAWPGVPAALITGDTAASSLTEAASLGVPLHHKPVRFDTLKGELERAIAHQSTKRGGRHEQRD